MADMGEGTRRHNVLAAELVHYGIYLQYTAGLAEAQHYMTEHGIPSDVIERVLSTTGAPRRHHYALAHIVDRRH
jgi:3-hydroxyisobutyrate dehydrogenase-like beta-hydroxyacid dehydrogenase